MTDTRTQVLAVPWQSTQPMPVTRPRRKTRQALIADLLGILALGSLVLTTWIWVRSGGYLQTFVYPEYAIGSQALLTGLLSSNLMVLQVFFLARIPWVEQSWGHDVLARRHRQVGYWSFWLMIAHVVLFAIERTEEPRGDVFGALWALFVTDPWMIWATLGTLMLIVVVVTSIRWARKRLRYESWHLLHLYSYLGMGLAFPHQVFDGTHFHELWTQIFFWGLYLSALAAVLVFRLGVPLWRSWYHRLRVTQVHQEVPGVVTVSMRGRHLDRMGTRSGQFFVWRFLDGPGWSRGKPYTISAPPRPRSLEVTIAAVGESSARAATLRPGTSVLIEGPYGTMTAERRTRPRMVLFAAGVGITPFRGILQDSQYAPGEAALVYRYTDDEHAIFRDELVELARQRGIDLYLLPGRRRGDGSWLPDTVLDVAGTDDYVLERMVPDIADRDAFICGPSPWIRSVRRSLKAVGMPERNVHHEDFAW
ncbi:ferric reductase-like transmembrane domain-containing protein [Promicromonospora sp. Populi]|uniref:ferredoxin reductase family protein n=1 Tax=Promicromonospora sp. Populi TaxID=3239420 RepID=UPI0034E20CF5